MRTQKTTKAFEAFIEARAEIEDMVNAYLAVDDDDVNWSHVYAAEKIARLLRRALYTTRNAQTQAR